MSRVFSRDVRLDTVKTAITFAAMGGDHGQTRQWAVNRWGENGAPAFVNKAEVPASSVADIDPTSTAGLVDRELFKSIRERALIFRMRGWRRTGFRVRTTVLANSQAAWVREGAAIPLLRATIDNVGLAPAKLAALSVWTQQALESSPGIEGLVFDDLARAFSDALDFAMFDPTNDGSATAPASITNGAPAFVTTGDIGDDLAELFAAFDGPLTAAYFVTTPQVAAGLSNENAGRDLGARGGELAGLPVLTSDAAPDGQLTLVDPSALAVAHDDDVELETSREATIEMVDATPAMDAIDVVPGAAASLVSMWQSNTVAIRAVGRTAWAAARPATVSVTGLFPDAT